MSTINVAVCQMQSTENVLSNLEQLEAILEAVPEQLDVAVFPENCLFLRIQKQSPIPFFNLKDPCFARLRQIAEQRKTALLLGSVPLTEGTQVFNAMVLCRAGAEPEVVYRKIHLFDVDVPGEKPQRESETFAPGQAPAILTLGGARWGLSICYDLRFSDLYEGYARKGCEILFVPSAFLVTTGKAHWHPLLRARAIESQAYVIAPAQSGIHRGDNGSSRQTFGHSLVVDPWGQVIGECEQSGPGAFVSKLDLDQVKSVRNAIPMVR
jgi:predicted amidohydrolase